MPYPHTYIKLFPEEKKRIEKEIERLTLLRKWKKRKPLQTLYLSNEQKPFRDIADYLKVSYSSVRQWVYRYKKEGLWFLKPSRDIKN